MVSWQGTDGLGRGIGSVPSEALAPAHPGSGIDSVMMDRVLGELLQTQREAAGRGRCPETGVERPERRWAEAEMGGRRHGRKREIPSDRDRDPEREGKRETQRPRETRRESDKNRHLMRRGDRTEKQRPRDRGQKPRGEDMRGPRDPRERQSD